MATTKAPLFGLDASGTIGGAIVFSKWRGRTYVRRHAIPANPQSGLQVGMRSNLKFISQIWSSLNTAQRAAWAPLAAVDNITDLNAMTRDAQRRARLNDAPRRGPSEAAGTAASAPTIGTIVEQYKTLVVPWTPGATAPQWAWAVYLSKTTGFTPDISNQIAIVPAATVTLTVPKLDSGIPYYFRLVGINFDGEWGTASTEATGTPD